MPAPDLRQVRNFTTLIRYLEDELGWPLDGYEMDDLTFDYEPSDLGLKEEEAAKVKSIRQLRPLTSSQPWGIFFIEFDKKQLPVVVLRRILSHLVLKKRASANAADAKRWNAQDLLFVSAFGPEDADGREIGFAHFHEESGDLPSLRVLGWDGDNTALTLQRVASTLKERLRWPEKGETVDAWRQRWSGAFKHRPGHIIKTSDLLAEALAALAKRIRDAARTLIDHETEHGPLRKLHRAFQTNLIHDLDEDGFADTYAQTITYGLLTAAINRTDMSGGRHGTFVKVDDVALAIKPTSPFLKEMLETFLKVGGRKGHMDFDELGVQDVVELLRSDVTDIPAILADFGNKTRGEDPVIHFYEHFLSAYNKKLKVQRGVFYTPQAVVGYIVRSVHELLQTEFGLEDGLASTITWGEMIEKWGAHAPSRVVSGAPAGNPKTTDAAREESESSAGARTTACVGACAPLTLPLLTDQPGETRTISPDEPFVQILDPATGTATFLVETIEVIHRTLKAKWQSQRLSAAQQRDAWNEYVPKHLLPRLHGYELMMAPYAIAHMKIGLKLTELGYNFASDARAQIYLTNALEPWMKQLPLIGFDALAHEAAAVNEVKRHKRFTVVIGNPPYSLLSANLEPHHRAMVEDYKFVNGMRIHERGALQMEKNLNDDYVKFIRLTQLTIDSSGVGVSGLITNHSFLDNATMRGVRWSLLRSASRMWLNDLHGNSTKQEQPPDGCEDVNVFQIKQGVAIALSVRLPGEHGECEAKHHELWGTRQSKEAWLAANCAGSHKWKLLEPTPEHFLFVPQSSSLKSEFETWPSLPDAMPANGAGYITARDNLVIDFERDAVIDRVRAFNASRQDDASLLKTFEVADKKGWDVQRARAELKHVDIPKRVVRTNYRPFDSRWIFFDSTLVWGRSWPTMKHVVGHAGNPTLLATRMTKDQWDVWVARTVSSHKAMSAYDTNSVFPLYLAEDSESSQRSLSSEHGINFSTPFLKSLASVLGLQQKGPHGVPAGLTPEDIFHYAYAVFHSPGYRSRYAEFLKIDFPRLPLTGNLELFRALAQLGGELTALHLLEFEVGRTVPSAPRRSEDRPPCQQGTTFIGTSREVTKVGYSSGTVWLNSSGTKGKTTAGTSGFRGVPEAVWNFHIGGYQVCEKWLKDRKGRTLTDEDIVHYHKIVIALTETIRLMAEIDEVIAQHGGWPGAFQTAQA